MYDEGTKKSTTQMALLLERLSRMSESMDARHRQATDQQERTVQALPGVLHNAADEALGNMTAEATHALRAGLDEPIANVAQRAAEHQRITLASTKVMVDTQHKLVRFVNRAIWLVTGVLAILVPVLVVGGYLGWHYKQVIAQHQIEAVLLRAYNRADVRLCGDQLCARVVRSDKRYGNYLPIHRRPE